MSGFFSLGGKDQDQEQQEQDTTNSLFLFKSEEIYNKDFELWRQYYQLQQRRLQEHQHHQVQVQDVDFSMGPSSSSRRIINNSGGNGGGGGGGGDSDDPFARSGFRIMTTRYGSSSGGGGSGSGGMSCQDCGNQAKKDCPHMRCRSCCKSRGFHCETHVKSTWVSASKRREKQQQQQQQQQVVALPQQQDHQNQQLSLLRGENPKRPRENPAGASSSGLEVGGHFPAEVNSPAIFRCVRVSAINDAEDQYAYQTAVNIGGHVFKGILYDQGPESRFSWGGEGSSSGHGGVGGGGGQQPLNLIAATAATTTTTTATASHHQAIMLDPSLYPTPLSAFMAGTQFFPPPRP